jgi:hypothetical protein
MANVLSFKDLQKVNRDFEKPVIDSTNAGISPFNTFTGDLAQRRANGGNTAFQYFNGPLVSQTPFNLGTSQPTTINGPLYVGALQQNGNVVNPFLGEIRMHGLANGLTEAQHLAWQAARANLQIALNRAV